MQCCQKDVGVASNDPSFRRLEVGICSPEEQKADNVEASFLVDFPAMRGKDVGQESP